MRPLSRTLSRCALALLVVLVLVVAPAGASAAACETVGANPLDPPRLTGDGSVVVFSTTATLVPQDTNRTLDVYAVGVATGAAELVSVRADGSTGDRRAGWPSVSADGRFVAFQSDASGVAAGDDAAGRTDVFIRDRRSGTVELVSATPAGRSGTGASSRPDITSDGFLVAFESAAPGLVADDADAFPDIFVRDVRSHETVRVSALPAGQEPVNLGSVAPSISATGRVAFQTTEAFVDHSPDDLDIRQQLRDGVAYPRAVVVRDLADWSVLNVSVAGNGGKQDGLSFRPDISADGRYVAFESSSANLVPGDTNNAPTIEGAFQPDIFVRDLVAGATTRVSVSSEGAEANGPGSSGPAITGDGGLVAYESGATNLVADDANGSIDVFVHDRAAARTSRASTAPNGADPGSAGPLAFGSVSPSFSGDGTRLAFVSSAPGLAGEPHAKAVFGVFVRTLDTGELRGPFGIGCRSPAVGESVSSAGSVPVRSSGAGLPVWPAGLVIVAGLAAAWVPRARRAATVATLALALAASTTVAGAHHYAAIQPGGPFLEETPDFGPGSLHHIYRDRTTGELYAGTAAHAVREFSVGSRVPLEGVGEFGTLVYSREGMNSFSRQDFALIRIDPDKTEKVDPAVRTWGGPTGIADPTQLLPGTPTLQYGQGAFFRNSQATRAKRGVLGRAILNDWGYIGWFVHTSWTFGGDSGSPVLNGVDGTALGITIAIAAPFGEPGESMGPTTALILQELDLVGFDVELVTAPFHGIPGDLRTAEHCASKPVEETAQNDGCVRPQTNP